MIKLKIVVGSKVPAAHLGDNGMLQDVERFMKSLHESITYEVLSPDCDGYFMTLKEGDGLSLFLLLLLRRSRRMDCGGITLELSPDTLYHFRVLLFY